jgi:hypothetical protein
MRRVVEAKLWAQPEWRRHVLRRLAHGILDGGGRGAGEFNEFIDWVFHIWALGGFPLTAVRVIWVVF